MINQNEKVKLLFNDFVVQYNKCNFNCDYCLNKLKPDETDAWKATNTHNILSYAEQESITLKYDGELKGQIDETLSRFQRNIDVPILRISGGEILAVFNIESLFERIHKDYEVVQIVTNGFYLEDSKVDLLSRLGNIHIHFSIDGHTLALNNNRVKSEAVQERLLDNLERCMKANIPLEISSVLTRANTAAFGTYLEYLLRYSGKLKVFPAPVRGEAFDSFYPTKEDIEGFTNILNDYDKYASILPAKPYIEELIKFLITRVRTTRCIVPNLAVQSLDKGAVTACPNGWTTQLGNLLYDAPGYIASKIRNSSIYDILTQKRPRIKYCKECFTAYDVVNLYCNGLINSDELRAIPLYSGERVFHRINEIKSMYC